MRWVVGGFRRTPRNKHQDTQVVRERVKRWSTPGRCENIHDVIEGWRAKKVASEGGAEWRGDRKGNSGWNPERLHYHRRKPGGGGVVGLVREKEIEVSGHEESGSMHGGAWGVTGQYGFPQGEGMLGGTASACVRSLQKDAYYVHTQNRSLRLMSPQHPVDREGQTKPSTA